MRKIVNILISLCLALCICACQSEKKTDYQIVNTIKDGANRDVSIRSDRNELTIASVYFVAVPFLEALNITNRVLAINARTSFWLKADENLNKAGTVGKGTVDLEKLASYAPDVLIHRSNDPETIEAVEKLGIDVICITVENQEDVITTLNMLGNYFGVEENATKAINWFNNKLEIVEDIVNDIPLEERKTALVMGGEFGKVAGSDMLQSWMIEKAGGIPVVEEGANHNWINIGVERVFSYNPEYIFVTSSAARNYEISELMEKDSYHSLSAVENSHIYEIPAKQDSWDMPGISCVLGIMYMLHSMYPERFTIDNLEDEVDDYYRFMFGRCFDFELGLNWDELR
ncbi:MAG: ABC transporter substrate-binding protein [Bacillota bacterium]|nr:ABC transporter substrate-binding protein [Bacillota bacterium]